MVQSFTYENKIYEKCENSYIILLVQVGTIWLFFSFKGGINIIRLYLNVNTLQIPDRNVVMRIDRKTDRKGTLTKMDYTKKPNVFRRLALEGRDELFTEIKSRKTEEYEIEKRRKLEKEK